jgi:hypothetical protein
VEVVRLSGTPDKRNGEWLRVRQYGYHTADVRSLAELERWFDLADLEPDEGGLARGRRVVARAVPRAVAVRAAALDDPVPRCRAAEPPAPDRTGTASRTRWSDGLKLTV